MNTNSKLGETVLIIDDDEAFALTLQRALKRHKFETYVAFNSDSALSEAKKNTPHYVLLDLKLGQESGLQLLEPLRASLPKSIIVVLTSYASITTVVDALKLGADNYLAKPVDTNMILQVFKNEPAGAGHAFTEPSSLAKPMSPKRMEWEHIQRVLKEHQGNISATARALGMHRRTLQRKLEKKPSQH